MSQLYMKCEKHLGNLKEAAQSIWMNKFDLVKCIRDCRKLNFHQFARLGSTKCLRHSDRCAFLAIFGSSPGTFWTYQFRRIGRVGKVFIACTTLTRHVANLSINLQAAASKQWRRGRKKLFVTKTIDRIK